MERDAKENKLKELINNNNLKDLRRWIQEKEIKSSEYRNFDMILIYSIENNATAEIIEYIISQRQYDYLNFQINGKIPLFIAVGSNKFKIADLLIKKGADINFEVTITYPEIYNDYNIISYLKYGLLNKKNMFYILKHNLNSNLFHYLIKMLILYDHDTLLESIFKFYIFDNTFILNLLQYHKSKVALSNFQLTSMISKEINKINIHGGYYKFAERVRNYNAIKIFFDNEYGDDEEILNVIIEYNLWIMAVKSKNYSFIKKVIHFKPFYYDKGNTFRFRRKIPLLQAIKTTITPEAINGNFEIGKLIVNSFLNEICTENNPYSYIRKINNNKYNMKTNTINNNNFDTNTKTNNNKYINTNINNITNNDTNISTITTTTHNINTNNTNNNNNKNNNDLHYMDLTKFSNRVYNLSYFNFILNKIIRMENFDLVKYLIDSEDYRLTASDINTRDIEGKFLIITAANCRGNEDIFNYLIDHGADGNTKDIHYEPLLLRVITNPKYFKYILTKPNIDINAKNKNGNYPLLEAIRRGKPDLVKQIMLYADRHEIALIINHKDADRNYPLLEAIEQNNIEIVHWLVEYANDHDINLNLNKKDVEGNYPILSAIKHSNFEIIKSLTSYADRHDIIVNINEKGKFGITPLLMAIMKNDLSIVKELISYARIHTIEIKINEKDKYQSYPLLKAIELNNFDIVNQLVSYARDYGIILALKDRDKHDHFPLLEAIKNNNTNIVRLLLEYARTFFHKEDQFNDEAEWNFLFLEALNQKNINNKSILRLFTTFIKDFKIKVEVNELLMKVIKQDKVEFIEFFIDFANEEKIQIQLETLKYLIKYNKYYQFKKVIRYQDSSFELKKGDQEDLLNYANKHKRDRIMEYLRRHHFN
ncbi:ankyrin [Neocallimastix sp. 'constans']|jgi:ankyrin repeat protein